MASKGSKEMSLIGVLAESENDFVRHITFIVNSLDKVGIDYKEHVFVLGIKKSYKEYDLSVNCKKIRLYDVISHTILTKMGIPIIRFKENKTFTLTLSC